MSIICNNKIVPRTIVNMHELRLLINSSTQTFRELYRPFNFFKSITYLFQIIIKTRKKKKFRIEEYQTLTRRLFSQVLWH